MTKLRLFGGLLFSILALACATPANAGEIDDAPPGEAGNAGSTGNAKDRYARGVHLFENGDYAGALAEFEGAQESMPSRLHLYQIAMTYVAMEKPVDALEALDEVISATGPLKPEYLARVKAAKLEQQQRVGQLDIGVSVAATLFVDGARVGEAPLKSPLSVEAGDHLVTAVAPGHVPMRKPVTVPAQGQSSLIFELQPTEAKLARVTISSPLLDAEIRIDDEFVGKTPFADPVAVLPGKRVIEMQRPGYMTASQTLKLTDGVNATVSFDPDEDGSAEADRGRLRIVAGGPVQLTLDSRFRGNYQGPIELPAGQHTIKLERPSYEPIQRVVDVPARGEALVKVALRPSEKILAAKAASVSSYRGWAVAAMVTGGLILGGSAGLWGWNNGKLDAAEKNLEGVKQNAAPGGGGSCDPNQGMDPAKRSICVPLLGYAEDRVNKYRSYRTASFVGFGVGAAIGIVGITLLFMAPSNPTDKAKKDLASSLEPVFAAGADGATMGLRGRF